MTFSAGISSAVSKSHFGVAISHPLARCTGIALQ